MSEAFEALLEACLKSEPGEFDLFVRPPFPSEMMEDMLVPLRILDKRPVPSASPSLNMERVGESVPSGGSARCRSLDSKKGRESSNVSDLGRGMDPFTVAASKPFVTK